MWYKNEMNEKRNLMCTLKFKRYKRYKLQNCIYFRVANNIDYYNDHHI